VLVTGGRGDGDSWRDSGDGWARQGRRCWRDDGDSGPGDGDGRRDDAGATIATGGHGEDDGWRDATGRTTPKVLWKYSDTQLMND
jgi:hypothetical protein